MNRHLASVAIYCHYAMISNYFTNAIMEIFA